MFPIARALLLLVSAGRLTHAATLDREIVLAPHAGTEREDRAIVDCQLRAGAPGATVPAFERLGWAYVAKARATLDAGYYKLAEKTADVMSAQFEAGAGAQFLRAHVLHNLHRFREAEAVAQALVAERGQPHDFALLSDTLVEQGKVEAATAALQRFADLNPGPEALSRIAHVRWMKGDLGGAIAAMESALRAGGARHAEGHAWMLTRLAALQLQAGDIGSSLALAETAERRMADYAPAGFARGRALVAAGRVGDAIASLRAAVALMPWPEFQWWLADVLRASDRPAEALEVERSLQARGESADPRTFALYLATRGEAPARAVRLARAELTHRQDALSHDALAWALAAAGEFEAADAAMRTALATQTKDARLFWHAGEIARMRGRGAEAESFFAQAMTAAATLTPSERARLSRSNRPALVSTTLPVP